MLFTDGVGDLLFPIYGEDEKENEKKKEIAEKSFDFLLSGDSNRLRRYCQRKVSTEGTLVVWRMD